MIPVVLFIFGATFIYAGILMSSQDASAGIVSALVGILMIIKPSVDAIQRFRALSGGVTISSHKAPGRRKKRHLTLVKTENKEKPTIH
jgi:hypothetical protein